MAAPTTRFDLSFLPPLKEFHFAVDRFAEDIEDFGDLFRTWAGLFQKEMGEQFETQGAASGDPWDDLTPDYKRRKEDLVGFVYPIGVLHGFLRATMTGNQGWYESINKRSAAFGMGENSRAAKYGPHFAERRPVIRMTPGWGRDWQKSAHGWLVDVSAQDWGGAIPKHMRTGGAGYQSSMLRKVSL